MSELNCNLSPDVLSRIGLVALDLDGTLFNDDGEITPATLEAIRRLTSRGIHVVICTGRPLGGVPFDRIRGTGIEYALTTNGAANYRLSDRTCIHEHPLAGDVIFPVAEYLLSRRVHIAAFIEGIGISPVRCRSMVPDLILPASVKRDYLTTRRHVDDLMDHVRRNHLHIQKITVNFLDDGTGHLIDREEVVEYLAQNPALEVVCGGFLDQEITAAGVDKGYGLRHLAAYLGVPMEQTMAVGDTDNDLAVLRAAGVAVAMGNATDSLKREADIITASNNEDGVARVLELLD